MPGTLKTGDYTLEGFEGVFTVERKGTTGEIAQNLVQDRFVRELDRLEHFVHPFLVCEFEWEDVLSFPNNSGIPRNRWKYLRIKPQFLAKRFEECMLRYRTKIVFAGRRGHEFMTGLFKRVVENGRPG